MTLMAGFAAELPWGRQTLGATLRVTDKGRDVLNSAKALP
jgi:hypothetical protein